MTEEWRFVKDNGETCYVYQVSSFGRVKSLRGGEDKIMSTRVNNWGYEIVNLSFPKGTKTKQVHRLVAEAFYGWREPKWQVNHKDCDKLNNRLDNLEWTTPKENSTHAKNHGRLSKRSDNLTTREILAIRKLAFDHNMTYQDIADVFDISRRTVAYQMAKKETDTRRQA